MKKIVEVMIVLLALSGGVTVVTAANDKEDVKSNTKKFSRFKAKADKSYEAFSYQKAIHHYKRALKENQSASVELKLADSYRLLNQPEEAELWYRAVLDETAMTDEDMLNFGQVLSANGKYEEALEIYENYQHHEDWVDDHVDALQNVERFYVNEIAFEIEESLFNSIEKDFSPTLKKDAVVFVTGRPSSGLLKPEFSWDGSNFLDLFEVKHGELPEKIHRGINTRYHEGPAVYFDGDQKMFFTRNNYHKKKAGESEDGVNMLKLYYSERKEEGKWNKPEAFTHNSDHHSTGHPAITSDGKTLYFASDMPGGYGGVDLYKSEWTGGQWSEPENLGERFNTAEDEMFPFLHDDQILYFSSTGHEGLGGLDLFRADLKGIRAPRNMGFPLNTNADDFGITLADGDNIGYFSSNRVGGTGDDDIYHIRIFDYVVHVNLIDGNTGLPIKGDMVVKEFFPPGLEDLVAQVEETNAVEFRSLRGSKFEVDGAAEDYLPGELEIAPLDDPDQENQITHLYYDLPLYPVNAENKEAEIVVVENNGKNTQVVRYENQYYHAYEGSLEELKASLYEEGKIIRKETLLKNIFYDFDKYNIREDAALELDKLYEFLSTGQSIHVVLTAHTDVRGPVAYNDILSNNRVKAAKDYLTDKGIDGSRIEVFNLGELQTFDDCEEANCSQAAHQANRRTEIKLLIPEEE